MTQEEVLKEKEWAEKEIRAILEKLNKNAPKMTEGISPLIVSAVGVGGSAATIGAIGTIGAASGYSTAGIASGFTAVAPAMGGSLLASLGALVAPAAVIGVAGYVIAKKRKEAKEAAETAEAIKGIYEIYQRLVQNAEYFTEELAGLNVAMSIIEKNAKKEKI